MKKTGNDYAYSWKESVLTLQGSRRTLGVKARWKVPGIEQVASDNQLYEQQAE